MQRYSSRITRVRMQAESRCLRMRVRLRGLLVGGLSYLKIPIGDGILHCSTRSDYWLQNSAHGTY